MRVKGDITAMQKPDGRPTILVSTGCSSADVVVAPVLAELKRREAVGSILAVGGEPLREHVAEILYDSTPLSTIGTSNGIAMFLRSGIQIYRAFHAIKRRLRDNPPDLVLLVDNAGVNFRLLALCHRFGIPVVYYVPPELWSVWRFELGRIQRAKPKVAAIFASQAEEYRALGIDAEWVGHPILDLVRSHARAPREIDGPPIIGLFPGSRRQELRQLLRPMRDAAVEILKSEPNAKFILCAANPMARSIIAEQASRWPAPVEIRYRESHRTLSSCHLALACSGTVTLEAALIGVPTVAMYRIGSVLDNLMRALALPFAKYPFFSLPNVLAGRAILPELGNKQVNGARIAAEAKTLLRDAQRRRQSLDDLGSIRALLGPPGAVERTADLIEQMLVENRPQSFGHANQRPDRNAA